MSKYFFSQFGLFTSQILHTEHDQIILGIQPSKLHLPDRSGRVLGAYKNESSPLELNRLITFG